MSINQFIARTAISILSVVIGFISVELIIYSHEPEMDLLDNLGKLAAYYLLPFVVITGIAIRILWTYLDTVRLFLGSKKGILLVSITTCIFLWVPKHFIFVNDLGFALLFVNAFLLAIVMQINLCFLFWAKK